MPLERLKAKDSLGFLAWKVSRLAANDLTARFVDAGVEVTVEQWRALIPLMKLDGVTQGKLCDLLSQEKTGVSRLVAALEKRGLIRREPGEVDRRVKHLYITAAGRELVESTVDMVVASRDALVAHIDPAELAICRKVLWDIIAPTLDPDSGCLEDEG